jgi:hypothetical protein
MSEFEDRQRGHEKKYELDQEAEFRAQARRAKLFGQWAAFAMKLDEEETAVYAKSMVLADLEEAGTEDLFRKVRADFDARGVAITDHEIRSKMDEMLAEARRQIAEGA